MLLGGPASAQTDGPAPAAAEAGAEAPALVPPELIEFVEAVLAPGAPAPEAERKVVLSVEVLPDGAVGEVAVLESGGDEALDAAALDAGGRLRFRPATWGGQPVPVKVRFTYRFVPPPPAESSPETPAAAAVPPPSLDLDGTVVERGTRRPLQGVQVQVQTGDALLEAVTDAEGRFELAAGPGRHGLALFLATHFPAELDVEVRGGERTHLKVFLLARPTDPYSTVVRSRRPRREVTRTTIEHREATRVAGTFGEPFRVIESLPGLQRVPFTGGFLVVRGANPRDTGVFLDGHEIPLLYHFIVGSAVFNADLVQSMDFSPGNWSVRHGRRLGGLVEVRTDDSRPERLKGQAEIDLIDAGALARAPLSDSTDVFAAVRRSHVAEVVSLFVDLGVVPRYWDYQLGGTTDLPGRWRGRLLAYGSDDGFDVVGTGAFDGGDSSNAPQEDEESTLSIGFHRLVARAWRPLPADGRIDLSASAGIDVLGLESGQDGFVTTGTIFEGRADVHLDPLPWLTVEGGIDAVVRHYAVDFSGPEPKPPWEFPVPAFDRRGGARLEVVTELDQLMPAAYLELDWHPSDALHVVPGVRVDLFDGEGLGAVTVDPRLVARWQVLRPLTLKGGVGLFHQPPEVFQVASELGDQGLDIPAALHASGGVELALGDAFEADVVGFSIRRWGLVRVVRQVTVEGGEVGQQVFDDGREERSYGLEVLLRHRAVGPFFGWISYTLSATERRDGESLPWVRHPLDQPHVFSAVGSYRLPDGWEVGARVRVVSGNPMTPVAGATYDADKDAYQPVRGEPRSDRLPAFFQVDLRVDKRWTFDTWILDAYLDLLNATNQANSEFIQYSYDFSDRQIIPGVPIFPSVGVKGEL